MSERDVKNFDEDLLKSDGKFKETMLTVFNKIIRCNGHPLSTSIQSMKENYTQMFNKINPRHFDNKQIVSTITEVATLASAEMLFAFCKYYKSFKKYQSELFEPLSQIVIEQIFSSAFDFVCKKTKDEDFRFELQSKKYMTSDLREVLNINQKIFPPKYPCDDTMFSNTIDELNKLEKSNSVDSMRECLVNSQTKLIEDVKAMHNNELPKNFDSDDLLCLLSFSLLYSTLKHPFGISLMLECFLTEDDFLTQAGYSLTSFTISIQSIIKMTESEGSMNKELLNNDPVEMLSRQTVSSSTTIVCRQPPEIKDNSPSEDSNSTEFAKSKFLPINKSKERKTHLRIGSRSGSTTSPNSPITTSFHQPQTNTETTSILIHKEGTSSASYSYSDSNLSFNKQQNDSIFMSDDFTTLPSIISPSNLSQNTFIGDDPKQQTTSELDQNNNNQNDKLDYLLDEILFDLAQPSTYQPNDLIGHEENHDQTHYQTQKEEIPNQLQQHQIEIHSPPKELPPDEFKQPTIIKTTQPRFINPDGHISVSETKKRYDELISEEPKSKQATRVGSMKISELVKTFETKVNDSSPQSPKNRIPSKQKRPNGCGSAPINKSPIAMLSLSDSSLNSEMKSSVVGGYENKQTTYGDTGGSRMVEQKVVDVPILMNEETKETMSGVGRCVIETDISTEMKEQKDLKNDE
ncbi:hypothetical protein QTN25_003236 [Entamoeba marina]